MTPSPTPQSRPTPTRPARPRGAARRVALLEATLALLGESGIEAVTHRAVAARAELPLASTTYWFASREELLTEALRHAADRDVAWLREAGAAALGGLAPGEPLAARTVVAVTLGPPEADDRVALLATYALLLESARRPGLQEILRDWSGACLTIYGELLARAGSSRPEQDARLLLAAADGLLIDHLATGGDAGEDGRAELERLVRALREASAS